MRTVLIWSFNEWIQTFSLFYSYGCISQSVIREESWNMINNKGFMKWLELVQSWELVKQSILDRCFCVRCWGLKSAGQAVKKRVFWSGNKTNQDLQNEFRLTRADWDPHSSLTASCYLVSLVGINYWDYIKFINKLGKINPFMMLNHPVEEPVMSF